MNKLTSFFTPELQQKTLHSFAYSFVVGTALSAGAYVGITAAVGTGLTMGALGALATIVHAATDPFFRKMFAEKGQMTIFQAIAQRQIVYIGIVFLSALHTSTRIIANRTNLFATILLDVLAIQMTWNKPNGSFVAIPFA